MELASRRAMSVPESAAAQAVSEAASHLANTFQVFSEEASIPAGRQTWNEETRCQFGNSGPSRSVAGRVLLPLFIGVVRGVVEVEFIEEAVPHILTVGTLYVLGIAGFIVGVC